MEEAHPRVLPPVGTWAAIHVKPRCEKVVADYLSSRGVPCFLPTVANRRTYGARVRISRLPLFPGYLFYDYDAVDKRVVYDSRRVVQLLVPDDPDDLDRDLENLARMLTRDVFPRRREFGPPGTPVEVIDGPLLGTVGELVRSGRHSMLVIRVKFLGFAAELTIDETLVRPR